MNAPRTVIGFVTEREDLTAHLTWTIVQGVGKTELRKDFHVLSRGCVQDCSGMILPPFLGSLHRMLQGLLECHRPESVGNLYARRS